MERAPNQTVQRLVADMSATMHLWKNPFCQADLFVLEKHFGGANRDQTNNRKSCVPILV
jgi:hypothetical protein